MAKEARKACTLRRVETDTLQLAWQIYDLTLALAELHDLPDLLAMAAQLKVLNE